MLAACSQTSTMPPKVIKVKVGDGVEEFECPLDWTVEKASESIRISSVLAGGYLRNENGALDLQSTIGLYTDEITFVSGKSTVLSGNEDSRVVKELKRKLDIANAQVKAERNKSETETTLLKQQKEDTEFLVSHTELFAYINATVTVPAEVVEKCYREFLAQNIPIPARSAKEVTRKVPGTVHQYFNVMIECIVRVLSSYPTYADAVGKYRVAYEEGLPPSRHIPDFHLRHVFEAYPQLLSAFMFLELKRETRPSTGKKNLIEEGWSDSVSYANAFISELLKSRAYESDLETVILRYSILSLALTPDQITACRVFSVPTTSEYGPGWALKQVSTAPLPLHNPSGNNYGEGFPLLVTAFALGPDRLHCVGREPLCYVEPPGEERIDLVERVGLGGSSDTYRALSGAAVKIRHSSAAGSLAREAEILLRLSPRAPGIKPRLPVVLGYSEVHILMDPCGVPLSSIIASLFAYQKVTTLYQDPDAPGFRTGVVTTVQTAPVGLLTLACTVLREVSGSLCIAHRGAAPYLHSDLRIPNVVMARWESNSFVTQPAIVSDGGISAGQVPEFNSALLVDWGHALPISFVTEMLPGNFAFAADAVLQQGMTREAPLPWVPLPAHDWESLAYLFWAIAHPVLGECPWQAAAGDNLVAHRATLLQRDDPMMRSVAQMVARARLGNTDLIGCVDVAALEADYQAMVRDVGMPFTLPHPLR